MLTCTVSKTEEPYRFVSSNWNEASLLRQQATKRSVPLSRILNRSHKPNQKIRALCEMTFTLLLTRGNSESKSCVANFSCFQLVHQRLPVVRCKRHGNSKLEKSSTSDVEKAEIPKRERGSPLEIDKNKFVLRNARRPLRSGIHNEDCVSKSETVNRKYPPPDLHTRTSPDSKNVVLEIIRNYKYLHEASISKERPSENHIPPAGSTL